MYVCTLPNLLPAEQVSVRKHGNLVVNEELRKYSDERWERDNLGWPNSEIPSVFSIDVNDWSMAIDCRMTEYKYLLGMVKMAAERKASDLPQLISGLSCEIMPFPEDGMLVLERRSEREVQQGAGFYEIPAYQNAQMRIDEITLGDLKDMGVESVGILDMSDFPRWNLMRHFGLKSKETGMVFYTGFARGFEVSIAPQFNGFARVSLTGEEMFERRRDKRDRLMYRFDDLPDLFDTLGNTGGKRGKPLSDVYGKTPKPTKDGFRLIDGCLGNLLSNAYHLDEGEEKRVYKELKSILERKGYIINEVPKGKINLDGLN